MPSDGLEDEDPSRACAMHPDALFAFVVDQNPNMLNREDRGKAKKGFSRDAMNMSCCCFKQGVLIEHD